MPSDSGYLPPWVDRTPVDAKLLRGLPSIHVDEPSARRAERGPAPEQRARFGQTGEQGRVRRSGDDLQALSTDAEATTERLARVVDLAEMLHRTLGACSGPLGLDRAPEPLPAIRGASSRDLLEAIRNRLGTSMMEGLDDEQVRKNLSWAARALGHTLNECAQIRGELTAQQDRVSSLRHELSDEIWTRRKALDEEVREGANKLAPTEAQNRQARHELSGRQKELEALEWTIASRRDAFRRQQAEADRRQAALREQAERVKAFARDLEAGLPSGNVVQPRAARTRAVLTELLERMRAAR